MAAVPLKYGNESYGGLNVYADRPDAFNAAEQAVLEELGDDIGHAIHAEAVKADLERARHRAEQYFETAGNIMVVLNRDGTVARINERGCDLLGCERAELIGSDWLERTAPDDIEGEIDEILFSLWRGAPNRSSRTRTPPKQRTASRSSSRGTTPRYGIKRGT
jgi:PAS domain-containing protein